MASFCLESVGTTFVSTRHAVKSIAFLKANRLRRPDLVLTFGVPLVDSHGAGLSAAESMSVHEEVYLAALDLSDAALSQRCIDVLAKRFPGSKRVRTLEAMALEAEGKFDEALARYNAILEDDPANTHVMKRRVAVISEMGNSAGAVKALIEYLDLYSSDADSWLELSRLYLGEAQYSKAAYCYEELLLLQPNNHVFHAKYAEVMYTMGGEHVKTARKYFAHSLNICPKNNARALYGLLMQAKLLERMLTSL
ncbi:hypothetical protein T492DRAFT_964167 [Pavlovales sp. CCMP2436]|nr:hypothetical protein T492DRAFT_964167 [Pavlovales sp. CCMP2436]